MSREQESGGVPRLLARIADRLEAFLEGDDLALETLGEELDEEGFTAEDVQTVILTLRSLCGDPRGAALVSVDDPPGEGAQRVLSAEERDSLSPEAWGYLINLRSHGSLDAEQFERVLDRLTASGVRPVGIELAREVAARVALRPAGGEAADEPVDRELAN